MSNSLASKLIAAAGKGSRAKLLIDSDLNLKEVVAVTRVPAFNVMLSGSLTGGLIPGITQLIGDSRTFKCVDKDTPIVVYVTPEVAKRLAA